MRNRLAILEIKSLLARHWRQHISEFRIETVHSMEQ